MSKEILNEIVEETVEETITYEVETPLEDAVEDDITIEEPLDEPIDEEMPPPRLNPLCVISKNTFGEYNVRDIQTSTGWGANPYEDYAVVPDDMVQAIMETRGFCDIVLNEEETEVVEFTAREIPNIPVAEAEPTTEDVLNALLGLEG